MLLTIAGVISAIAIINAVYPAITRSTGALASASSTVDEKIRTNVAVVHAIGELNAAPTPVWVDTNSNSLFDFFVWVKNVGDARIPAVKESDVFLGQVGAIEHVPYVDDAAGAYPQWSYAIENDTEWSIGSTLKVTIAFNDGCPASCLKPAGTYFVKLVTPNGVASEHYFSI